MSSHTTTPANGAGTPEIEPTAAKTERFADAAHRAVDTVADQLAEAERKLRDGASTQQEALRDAVTTAATKAKKARTKTRRFIDENSLMATGMAFAAGILFASWLRR